MTTSKNYIADPRLYILIRNDMASMTLGRGAAQASHGTSLLHEAMHKWRHETSGLSIASRTKDSRASLLKAFDAWRNEVGLYRAFGTTIVLSTNKATLDYLDNDMDDDDTVWRRSIVDPSYGIIDGLTRHQITVVTGLAVFGSQSWLTSQYGLDRLYLWGEQA